MIKNDPYKIVLKIIVSAVLQSHLFSGEDKSSTGQFILKHLLINLF
jgi:hypothetical protein